MLELAGYQEKKQLYAGSRTIVYRAIGAKDREPVIIKVLRNPHPSFHELVQFRNQYIITRNLENPRIVRPIALERYGNGYALVMPDDGAIALSEYWQQSSRSLAEFIDIAIQLSVALHYLSGQRIIHKDIKPANILIHPVANIEALADLPEMTDLSQIAALRVLIAMVSAAVIAALYLLVSIAFKMVTICISYGNSKLAPYAYGFYAWMLCIFLGKVEIGYRF